MGVYFVSTVGSSGNAGTAASPWDFVSALDGTQTVEAGSTIWMLPGTYSAKYGSDGLNSIYYVRLPGTEANPICVKPLSGRGSVIIDGQFYYTGSANAIELYDLQFYNSDAVPVGEPAPNEEALGNWGAVGIWGEAGDFHKLINLDIHGGAQGLSLWTAGGSCETYGCLVWDVGWLEIDRSHGHAVYVQNALADLKSFKHCLLTTRHAKTDKGNYAFHAYTQTGEVNNISVEECFMLGAVLSESRNASKPQTLISFINSVVSSGIVGDSSSTDGNGLSIGYATYTDTSAVFTGNKLFNTSMRVVNGIWSALTISGNTLYKTDSNWWEDGTTDQTPAQPVNETRTFSDVSDGSGTDAVALYVNEYDANVAYAIAMAIDTDNLTVSIDPSSFLEAGDDYKIWRFGDTAPFSDLPLYEGTWESGSITVTNSEVVDAYIIKRVTGDESSVAGLGAATTWTAYTNLMGIHASPPTIVADGDPNSVITARPGTFCYVAGCLFLKTGGLNNTDWIRVSLGGTLGTLVFTSATRSATTPEIKGQLGVQTDDLTLWMSNSTTAGDWSLVVAGQPVIDTAGILGDVGASVSLQNLLDKLEEYAIELWIPITTSDLLSVGENSASLSLPAKDTYVLAGIDIQKVDANASEMGVTDWKTTASTIDIRLSGTEDVEGGHRVTARWLYRKYIAS